MRYILLLSILVPLLALGIYHIVSESAGASRDFGPMATGAGDGTPRVYARGDDGTFAEGRGGPADEDRIDADIERGDSTDTDDDRRRPDPRTGTGVAEERGDDVERDDEPEDDDTTDTGTTRTTTDDDDDDADNTGGVLGEPEEEDPEGERNAALESEVTSLITQYQSGQGDLGRKIEILNRLSEIGIPSATTFLAERAAFEKNPTLLSGARSAVWDVENAASREHLANLAATSPSNVVRMSAYAALSKMEGPSARTAVQSAANDSSVMVRWMAVYMMGRSPHADHVETLQRLASADPDPDVQTKAKEVLAKIRAGSD